jgi:hypothetical protein
MNESEFVAALRRMNDRPEITRPRETNASQRKQSFRNASHTDEENFAAERTGDERRH